MNKKYFKGSIVIGDPSYFVETDEDWELCEYGMCMHKLGFSDYLFVEFPDDPQIVINTVTNEVLGGLCQDSGVMIVVYKHELESYNANYEKCFFSKNNRAIIDNFEGEVGCKRVSVIVNGHDDSDTIIFGEGNISFKSCYEEDLI